MQSSKGSTATISPRSLRVWLDSDAEVHSPRGPTKARDALCGKPIPVILTRMAETVEFRSNGTDASGYLVKPPSGSGPGILVIQEWWGLDSGIKEMADRLGA